MNNRNHISEASSELKELEVLRLTKTAYDYNELLVLVSEAIDHLILANPNELIQLMYALDISEQKLKQALQQNDEPPAVAIAAMIIERQLQKIKTRKAFQKDRDIPDDERW